MSESDKWLVCVGSLHCDIIVESPRIPQISETVPGSRWYPKFGGKGGNQALAAAAAGANVRMLGAIGSDEFGKFLRSNLSNSAINVDHICELRGSSGMSVAISEQNGDYGAVIVPGVNLEIPLQSVHSPKLWDGVELLMLQNEVSTELNVAAAASAKAKNAIVCLNAAPFRSIPESLSSNIDIVVANALEAASLLGTEVASMSEARQAALELQSNFPISIVTVGELGAAVASAQTGVFEVKAHPVRVQSTHGAGDVFTGAFCAELLSGTELRQAVSNAAKWAESHISGGCELPTVGTFSK